MIKIKFENPAAAEAKYLRMVKPGVVNRLKVLKKTLDDINGGATRVTGDNIDSYQVTTRELINLVETPKLTNTKFHAAKYIQTVDDYVADPNNKLGNLNIPGLTKLVDDLLDDKTKILDGLFICPVTKLATLNRALLTKYKLNTPLNKSAIKLAFSYQNYKEIAKEIKAFFREENIVLYCPYCNMLEADYSEDDAGEPSTIHYLDHFFDKASTPLLCYSMYNLVPCDGMCNGSTIKHDTPFDEKYHLSPYERGFDKDMMIFEAVIGNVSDPVDAIYLNIIPIHGSPNYRRLAGDGKAISEKSKKGNINVFKLKSRYNRSQVREVTGGVVRKLNALVEGRASLNTFLKGIKLDRDSYKKWYRDEFHTEFDEQDFHKKPYSKLHRDLHDAVVMKSATGNDDLKKYILSKNP